MSEKNGVDLTMIYEALIAILSELRALRADVNELRADIRDFTAEFAATRRSDFSLIDELFVSGATLSTVQAEELATLQQRSA